MTIQQRHFNPLDYGFAWIDGWYSWDFAEGHKAARAARAALAKELKAIGFEPVMSSMGLQLVSRGGVGSGHPHVTFAVTCYMLAWQEA